MSTGSSTPIGIASPGRQRRGLPRLRDARIRSKLGLILLVPLLAVLALAGVRLVDIGGRAVAAGQVEDLTRLATRLSQVTQAMQDERMSAAAFLATPAGSDADKPAASAYTAAVDATDRRIQEYNQDRRDLADPPDSVADRLNRIDDHLKTLDATRTQVSNRNEITVTEAVLRYGVVITDLVGYVDSVGQFAGEGTVADGLRALAAFTRAKAGTSDQEATAYAARAVGDTSDEALSAFIATQTSQQEALLAFSLVASPAQQELVDSTVTGDAVNLADDVSTRFARAEPVPPSDVRQSLGAVVDLMRWAEQRLESRIVDLAADDTASASRQAALESVAVLIVLILAIALAVVLARSLNLSLRRLREGALSVANRDLPDAVARLRDARNLGDGGAEDIVRQVRDPIRLENRDEVGQVAQAFNVVHREAVRIAAEQAALRTSVSAMFLNLARRSQNLVDRMIGELDQIERGEEDPKRLAQLFELDHLATRMRRNDENLLVLAGADSSAPRREDALLIDALRAAQSEVELYNRIEFGAIDTDLSITAAAVNDVVRLIAELLDNATRFSPPNTTVVADARRVRDYVVVQVEDRGLGMSAEQMSTLNRRLSEPPSVDVAAFRLMGLAVVGRLASRYGIRIELRANMDGGTIAHVMLPASIVIVPGQPIDPPRTSRTPQLDSGPSSWDSQGGSRGGVATLPAIAPEPWGQQNPELPQHPALPAMPSQRPVSPSFAPTADRPPLPTRTAQPVAQSPASAPPASAPPASAPPASAPPSPAYARGGQAAPDRTAFGGMAPESAVPPPTALGSPTVAYPTVRPSASPDLQVAVGFITPDGRKVPPPPVPASPHPNGWGAALASMPTPPPPPARAPAEDRSEAPIFLQMQQSWFRGRDGQDPDDWGMPTAGYAPPPTPSGTASPAADASASAAPAAAGSSANRSGVTRSTGSPNAAPASAQPGGAGPATGGAPNTGGGSTGRPLPRREPAAPGTEPMRERSPGASEQASEGASSVGNVHNGSRSATAGASATAGTENGGSPSVPRQRDAGTEAWRTAADEGWQRAMAAAQPQDAGTTRSGLPKRVPQAQLVPGGVQTGQRNQNRRSPDEVRGLLSAYHRGVQRGRTAGSAENETASAGAPAPKEND
ncbi:sensor histidine kinase [Mangrovihabitans endophyticus]|uniref:histidine kinase n=1 Tax=Mangrovihabitans endophyticus TaxID=1751298 RepID=A0A8J3C0E2_9ACTN|nr:nitrate- and nitrite sensing domain-containing protein [Mangrovihabitans endophyticus]GGK92650.1 hypothetical protein GCM10012284_28120 [Mangrovihabitans endophyticus]